MKLDEEIQKKVITDLRNGISYSVIQERYGIKGKATINRIKNKFDTKLEVNKPNGKTIAHRRKLKEAAFSREVVKQSQIMAGGIINVLNGIEYSVKNLEEIQDNNKKKNDEVVEDLKKILSLFDDHIYDVRKNSKGVDVGKMEIIRDLNLAISKVGDFVSRDVVRIKAIAELRNQIASFVELKVVAEELGYVKQFIQTLFKHLQVMTDEQYIEYRNKVISEFELAKPYFDSYEKEVD